ncbi:MAG: hypothetical protein Ct9H300mP1_29010 [Planctomycetaceae bacterium]|nr:MAG: hypothetical protein Ct9H300mP1_29010 [Planctomycetaceae bacterium]
MHGWRRPREMASIDFEPKLVASGSKEWQTVKLLKSFSPRRHPERGVSQFQIGPGHFDTGCAIHRGGR